MEHSQTSCNRCGTCCLNGGPALHGEDLRLIREGSLPLSSLITIRKGELVHHPTAGRLLAAKQELIKTRGAGRQWTCLYYNAERKGCAIYKTRPLACRVLKCWDTEEIEALIDHDTLSRTDVMEENDPLRESVIEHERLFPCPDLDSLLASEGIDNPQELEALANKEIAYRTSEVARHGLTLNQELFYFGRPLFQLFASIGAAVRESGGRLMIRWPER